MTDPPQYGKISKKGGRIMQHQIGTGIFQLIALAVPLLSIVVSIFLLYFLVKVLQFMKIKTQQDAQLLQKIDDVIELKKKAHVYDRGGQ